jgi:regulator of protease activity HflC (stomatin/prohibitin superfamily)
MSAYRVIDKMEIVVREGIWLPFGWRAVNSDQVLDLIEKLRSTLPDASRPRKADGTDRDVVDGQFGTSLSAEARSTVDTKSTVDTRSTAATAADIARQEREVTARAESRADTIIADAQKAARDIRRGADEYADQVLASLDASLAKALAAVQKGRQTLASSATSGNGKSSREMSSL